MTQDDGFDEDRERVVDLARGYFLAFRDVAPESIRKHFREGATKIGFMYDPANDRWLDLQVIDREQASLWASTYNQTGHMPAHEPAIEVLDLQSKIAVVRLSAEWAAERWGIDYVCLVKEQEQWRIASILWQSVGRPERPRQEPATVKG